MKRLLDILASIFGLVISSPLLLPTLFLVWWQDKHSPFYVAPRVGLGGRVFNMIKLRSMTVNADRTGVDSTSANDKRITRVGHFIRSYKLDELTQLWNVLIGDMSLVGPRPNVKRETDLYTIEEQKLLTVRPGITDFSSIVFADEGDILKDSKDPDIDYNQLIRPWKSRLGLFYIQNRSLLVDIKLVLLTVGAVLSRDKALQSLCLLLKSLGANDELIQVSRRQISLVPTPPPGSNELVVSRTT